MKTILLVEDCADIIMLYREQLLLNGFEVIVAEDGLEAMKTLHQTKPDLVLLDLSLPKFNGAEVLKYIRTNPPLKDTKVIIFSNSYLTDLGLAASKIGANATLAKAGCSPSKLIEAINKILEDGGAMKQPTGS